MEREYYIRGQRKIVEEIEAVNAIKTNLNEQEKLSLENRGLHFNSTSRIAAEGMPEDTRQAFEKANWIFVESSDDINRVMMTELPINTEDSGKVIKRSNGRFAVITRRLSVQLDPSIDTGEAERILNEQGFSIINRLRFAPNFYEVETVRHNDAMEASVELNSDKRFLLAEPSFIEHIPQRLIPSDPEFRNQWQWSNKGQNGGTLGADVHIEEAWDITRGAGIRIAVIDNGFNVNHEDLREGIGMVSGFYRENGNNATTFFQGTAGMPVEDHGTFCAGIVGARQNNSLGGCGAAPESELMLVACLVDQVGTQTTLARSIAYCADPTTEVSGAGLNTGADILVCSLGPNGADWDLTATLQIAIEFAAIHGRQGLGLTIFWAASNGHNVDILKDEVVSHKDVIAVVRSNRNDLEDNAAKGSEVELIAPGVEVVSTTGNGYGPLSGTSFAAPCAAGCAALGLSVNPGLSRDELRMIMRQTADKIGGVTYDVSGHNDDYGFGRVNAMSAVQAADEKNKRLLELKDHIIRVKLTAPTIEGLRAFINKIQPDLGCRPSAQRTSAGFVTDIYIPESKLLVIQSARSNDSINLTILEDTTAIGLSRQAEVGQGNRFASRESLPKGIGRKE